MNLLDALWGRPFLTPTEQEQIEAGLATARRHAGEPISLMIDARASGDPEARAVSLFAAWDIAPEARARAILLYVCAATRRFAVVGGDEVRRLAPPAFWKTLDRDLTRHFDEGRYCDGLFKAIAQIAVQLHVHFHPTLPGDTLPVVDSSSESTP
jgi:uncharacterized membrane protein YgcG